MVEAIIIAVVMSLLVGTSAFVTKVQKGEPFTLYKLVRTVLVGIALGVTAGAFGVPVPADPEGYALYAAANAGTVAVADQVLKFLWRLVRKPIPGEGA